MREDMDKVIVERPRYGSRARGPGKGYRKAFQRCAWEDQPKREPLCHHKTKNLNEHLGPLRRYLRAQVGRPWAKVHAEICAHISRDSAVQDHVRDHVDGYVETQVITIDGVACHAAGWRAGRPLTSLYYVCPRTGQLRENPHYRRRRRREELKLKLYPHGDGQYLVRFESAWRVIVLKKIPLQEWCPRQGRWLLSWEIRRQDALLGSALTAADAESIYGSAAYAAEAWRARRREVRGVVNSYPFPNRARRQH